MDNKFSYRLIEARKFTGLSQKDAAKALGITPVTLNRYEKGHREPEREVLLKIAELYNCDASWLLTGEKSKLVREESPDYNATPRLSQRQLEAAHLLSILDEEDQDEVIKNMKKDIVERLTGKKKGS